MIGLADCNNFFVSCERTLDRSLEGRAVVVLSNNDGCVVARSNEAKRLGIRMGEPAFKIADRLRSGEIIALSGNHLLYREISLRIHDIFRRYAPATLDYSVDEAFLLMDGIPESSLPEIGEEICRACMDEEHIPITIGFAATKTLAKVATEVGKKSGRKVIMLTDEAEIESILKELPLHEMWGMGRRLTKRMYIDGVYTVGDFAARPVEWVRSRLGVVGERSWRELHGESCIELEHLGRKLQESISETRTFPTDVDDYDYIRSRIAIYCAHVSKRLRHMQGVCSDVCVQLSSNRFHTEHGFIAPTGTARLDPATDDASVIAGAAIAVLEQIYDPRFAYKRAGVTLSGITRGGVISQSLFQEEKTDIETVRKSKRLMQALDNMNRGAGPHVIKLASELTHNEEGHNDGYSSSFGPPPEL